VAVRSSRDLRRPAAPFRHARPSRGGIARRILSLVAVSVVVLLVSGLSVAAIALARLNGNVESVALPEASNAPVPAPGVGAFEAGFDMLIVGSDECVDSGGCPDRTEKLNDFTMLLHVADDHRSAVAVTFPRDLIVPIPACPREDGSGDYPAVRAAQINTTLKYGGLPCTVLTVRALTGLPVEYAGIMTFEGVRQISTALGGVPVCIDAPIKDPRSGLDLPAAGTYYVQGEQALQFLRTRYGVGDGSDTGRIGSQQAFLASMVREIKSGDTLTDFPTLYALAQAASSNMTLSENIGKSVTTLASMALVLKDIPLEQITFVKYPAGASDYDPNRVVPIPDAAAELFARIAADQPVVLDPSPAVGVAEGPSATPAPVETGATPTEGAAGAAPTTPASPTPEAITGATGLTAADQVCSKSNS
jgi:LCP family protein required for cell wall assembly